MTRKVLPFERRKPTRTAATPRLPSFLDGDAGLTIRVDVTRVVADRLGVPPPPRKAED